MYCESLSSNSPSFMVVSNSSLFLLGMYLNEEDEDELEVDDETILFKDSTCATSKKIEDSNVFTRASNNSMSTGGPFL